MKTKGISGSTLKIIAIVTMLIDHIGAAVLGPYVSNQGYAIGSIFSLRVSDWPPDLFGFILAYVIMRFIGRIAFPIFCFLLVEGFLHTRNVKAYFLRLLAFCFLSEIPFDLAFFHSLYEPNYQNVFFTLSLGLLAIWSLQRWKNEWYLGVAAAVACGLAANVLHTDYSLFGVALIVLLYVTRHYKEFRLIMGVIACSWELTAPLAFVPIGFYNGQRGLGLKYFFYAFYPLHLLLLYFICQLIC